jgi:DNA-binding NtrC family response regulator
MMKRKILFLNSDNEESPILTSLFTKKGWSAVFLKQIGDLHIELAVSDRAIVFLDIDSVPIDNRGIRELKALFPNACLFCISKHPFHPELKEAISNDIFACLTKPLDPKELAFWVESIESDDCDQGGEKGPFGD